jgi:hypothetical protein
MRMLSSLLVIALMMGLIPQMALTVKADSVEYGLWVGGTRVTSENASDIPAKIPANKTGGTASYNAETKTLTLDNYKYSGDCEDVYYKYNNIDTYGCHTVIFVNDINIVSTIIIKGNVSLIQSDSSSSPYGLTYLVSDSKLTIKGEGENPKLTVSSGNSNGSGGGASNGIYIYGSHLHIKDCAVEATGGNSNTDSSGIFPKQITLENSTLTASCNNTSSGSYARGYGIRFLSSGKLTIDNKSTVTVIGNTKAVDKGTVVNSGAGTGWDNMSMSGVGTPIGVSETGASYDYKAMQFLPPPHTHSFSYSASGATITATCSADGCGLTDKKATLTIVSPTRTTYGGTGDAAATLTGLTDFNTATNKTVAVGDIKYVGRDGTTYSESTTAPTDAGKYTAKITIEGKTACVDYEIAKASETAPNSDTTQLNINYTAETISAKDGYEVAGDGSGTSISSFSDILDSDTPTVYIRKTVTDNNHNPSAWVAVTLAARPAAPTGLGSINSTNETTADGTITNVNDTMEYSADGATWTIVPSTATTIPGLNPGTYSVRVKATESAPHGVATTVTVGSNYVALTEANKPTISVSDSHNPPVVGDTLTASTTATDIVYEWYRGNEAISGATGESYTVTASDLGKTIKVKVTQTKQENGSDYASGSAPTMTSSATGVVEKRTPEQLSTDDAKTNAGISYVAETVTPIEGFEVSSSAEAYVAVTSLTAILDAGDTPTIYVRSKETSDMKAGAWVAVALQGRSAAPQELSSTPAADQETENGTITGTSASQEYKLKGSTNLWTAIGGSSVSVAAGTYLVRERATTERPAGYTAEIVVHSKKLYPTDAQKPTIKSNLTYTGSAQSLLGEPSAELPAGSTMYYALGENAQIAPVFDGTSLEEDKKWSTTIPAGTEAKTYYVWYMAKGDGLVHTDSDPVCITVTISNSAPSGGGGSASEGTSPTTPTTPTQESYTVSIENESSLAVATEITDGNAKVSEITGSQIQQITANSEETGGSVSTSNTITIDVSGATQEVNSVELTKGTVERLADTAMSNNSVDTVTIQMTNAAVEMDAKTLEAVSQQAKDDEIRLVVEDTQHVKLTAEQQSSIRQYTSAATFEAYFISGGTRIGNFKGGVAKVSVKYTLQAGNSRNFLHMIYLPVFGGTEYFPSRYFVDAKGYGWVQGDLPHFSDYAIVYDENKLNQDGELAMDPYSGLNQEAFDPDKSDFVEDDATVLANGKTAYQNGISLNSGLKLYQKGSTLGVTWGKVVGADGYRIYAAYCGSRMPVKPIKVTKKTKYTIKKLNGKKLNLKKNYKVYVVAYKKVDGVDKILGRTVTAHVVGRKNAKFSNPKKLTITSKTKVSLKTGKTTKVKAKVTLVSPKRKSLSDGHAPLLRFASSNKKVATVDKTGKVKGIGKGTCVIYVYAKNGYTKKVKITVK